ncbi:MAG: EamA-like transporter family protein [Synergistetes bacterium ADurb.Bin155]|nr:MAG: EamA-like transporter family protein [Synergistetes bacterium ADurb.Bin155]HOC81815.1 DMT family transporter [Synergistales bacterium]
MDERKRVFLADASMFIVAVFWGSGFGVTSWLLGFFSPMWLMAVRFTMSALVLLMLFKDRLKYLGRKDIFLGVALGFLLFLSFAAHIWGLVFSTPGKQSFISASNVVMVPFLFALFYRRWPSWVATAGAFITTAGLLVMAFTPGMTFNFGDFLSLVLALGIALHVLGVGNLSRRMDPVALTVVQLSSAGFFFLATALVFESPPHVASIDPRALLGLLYVVVLVTVIPFLVQTVAQRFSPEVHAAILLSLEGPFGYVIAVLIGQEVLNFQIALGGAVILIGVALAEFDTFIRKTFHLPGPEVLTPGVDPDA